ncbi:MAG TPA: S1 RNA-binding domain-containing protein [Candidatus Acidoferrales bacterium]|nr:S1 RNA-binding domain-containing protein [Candidatus Acidoferrales bacterium]
MFSDHENQTTAAAPAKDDHLNSSTESTAAPEAPQVAHVPETADPAGTETAVEVHAAAEQATAAPVAQADGDSGSSSASAQHEAHAQASAQDAASAEAAAAEEEAAGSEEMSKLIEQYDEQHEAASQNEIIEVKVVAYTEQGVVVDLGGKTEGLIPASEFHESDIPRPEPNSTIEVQRTGENKEGYALVSYQKVLRRRTWEKLDAAFKAKETLTGKVVDRIKGGLVVDIGVRAFLPGSQYDLRPAQNLDSLLGQEIPVRITKLNRRRGNVVVSRRALLEEELHAKRAALMETLSEGQIVHGHVKNVTE